MRDPYRHVRAADYPGATWVHKFKKTFFYLAHWNTHAEQMSTTSNKCKQMLHLSWWIVRNT